MSHLGKTCRTAPPSNIHKSAYNTGDFTYQGIDRVDNTQGYHMVNCVPCCKKCNQAKLAMSKEELIDLARAIVREHGNT